MFRDLLLVIDMQNIYLTGQAWGCWNTADSVENIIKLLESGKAVKTIFTQFKAPDKPVGTWKNYNKTYSEESKDPWLNDMIDELKPYVKEHSLYSKNTYSSFSIPEVTKAAAEADRILITGVVSECCILATLLAGIDLGLRLVYITDGVSAQTQETEEMVHYIANTFSPIHVDMMTTEEYLSV